MKKICLLIAISLILSLSACSEGGIKASDKAISCANAAVKIGESYLSYEITYKEASARIDKLQSDMNYVHDDSDDSSPNHIADLSISSDILALSLALTNDNYNSSASTYDEITEVINSLKDDIKNYD